MTSNTMTNSITFAVVRTCPCVCTIAINRCISRYEIITRVFFKFEDLQYRNCDLNHNDGDLHIMYCLNILILTDVFVG